MTPRWVMPAVLLVAGLAAPGPARAEELDDAACLACHGDPSAGRFVDAAQFEASVHGAMGCAGCHADVTTIPHDLPVASVAWQQIPATCGQCHADVAQAYAQGIHGQAVAAGKRGAPVCTDCHGVHAIQPVKQLSSTVFPSRIPETCGQCHAAERITTRYRLPTHVVGTYMESFHGLALQLGSVTAANCASCHGAHAILPPGDPGSSVHPANLGRTCGQCHAGVSAQVAHGKIHAGTGPGLEPGAVSIVRWFYLILIGLVVGGMAVHNGLDFRRKLCLHYRRMSSVAARPRMSLSVRVQHGILIAAFTALAYTGFALKFPQAWWASPFVGHVDWRRLGHRAAAVLFCALALYHLGYVLFTSRGRHHARALAPRRVDFIQPFQMLAYSLGRRAERPVFARYSYIEKAEYWALVWGSVIMTVTGGLMTWQNWTLRVFPKWFFDVLSTVHFYEAVLACLAIVVWHGYFVMFDPDEYPMKWTWVTGLPSPADREHRREDPHRKDVL